MSSPLARFLLLSAAVHVGALAAIWPSASRLGHHTDDVLSVQLIAQRAASPHTVPNTEPRAHSKSTRRVREQRRNRARAEAIASRKPPAATPVAAARAPHRASKSHAPQRAAVTRTKPAAMPPPTPAEPAQVVATSAPSTTPTREKAVTANATDYRAGDTSARVREALQQQLTFHHYYPPVARDHGWQGRVRLGVRIEADGRLSRVKVLQTSGYSVLDQAALDSIRSIGTLREARPWLNGAHSDIVLPVIYKLLNG